MSFCEPSLNLDSAKVDNIIKVVYQYLDSLTLIIDLISEVCLDLVFN